MSKSKAVEYLRGMRFMQRKEESNRRELFETQRRQGVLIGQRTTSSSSNKTVNDANGPTILRDSNFPKQQYSLSRQSFLVREEAPAGPSSAEKADPVAVGLKRMRDDSREEYPDNVWGEGSAGDEEEDGSEEDLTAVGAGKSFKDKFIVSESVRAPKLPRKLEQTVENLRKK